MTGSKLVRVVNHQQENDQACCVVREAWMVDQRSVEKSRQAFFVRHTIPTLVVTLPKLIVRKVIAFANTRLLTRDGLKTRARESALTS
jgi:hypothetical protein